MLPAAGRALTQATHFAPALAAGARQLSSLGPGSPVPPARMPALGGPAVQRPLPEAGVASGRSTAQEAHATSRMAAAAGTAQPEVIEVDTATLRATAGSSPAAGTATSGTTRALADSAAHLRSAAGGRTGMAFLGVGAQGKGFVWAAVKALGAHNVGVHVRTPAKFDADARIALDGPATPGAGDPTVVQRVDLVKEGRTAADLASARQHDPARTVFFSVGTAESVPDMYPHIPDGAHIVHSQNGAYSQEGIRPGQQASHMVSMIATRDDATEGVRLADKGFVELGEDNPDAPLIYDTFTGAGLFGVKWVQNGDAAKWQKIALNTALNSLATVYGATLGELAAKVQADPTMHKMLEGVVAEVCSVAAALQVQLSEGSTVDKIKSTMEAFPRHPTSLHIAVRANKKTEVDVLSGGVAALGRNTGIATPLCDALTTHIKTLQAQRAAHTAATPFYDEPATAVMLSGMQNDLREVTKRFY